MNLQNIQQQEDFSMNLPAIQENNISMTSQEIAELLDVRHDSVKRSIERLVELGVINQPPLVDGEKSANHVVVKVYLFTGKQGKRDTYVVVAQLSPEFTATIVDRWQELENQVKQPVIALPQDYETALEHLLVQVKENKQLAIENKVLKPKADAYDRYLDADGTMSTSKLAKAIGFRSAQQLNQILAQKGVCFERWGAYEFYASWKRKDLGKYVSWERNGKGGNDLKWLPCAIPFFEEFLSNEIFSAKAVA